MRTLSRWIIGTFASPVGIVLLGVLDATVFFSMPFGIDVAVIILAARSNETAWLVPCLATIGSAAGAAVTYWMGATLGEHGLSRYVPPKRLDRVRGRIRTTGAMALASLSLIPPPFPFTVIVLVAGALKVRPAPFFSVLVGTRLTRFGVEAYLATRYGQRIVGWLEAPLFQNIVLGGFAVAVLLTTISIVRLTRRSRGATRPAAA